MLNKDRREPAGAGDFPPEQHKGNAIQEIIRML